MFDGKNHRKIKNVKILRWQIELSQFDYEVVHRAGEFNTAPDVLSRIYCAQILLNQLYEVHSNLCHPGVTRMYHYVRAKNLAHSLDEVRKMTASSKIYAELKPHFYKLPEMRVIKATRPMERLSIDFKGPIGNLNRNNYMLTVIDEYSRFLFAFPCSNINAETVISV